MQNKKSIWSTIILIVAILTIITTTINLVSVATSIDKIKEIALEAAHEANLKGGAAQLVVNATASSVVTGAVIGAILAAFEIVGGFLFSLKGKWGTFCIVISILGIIGQGISLSSN